MRKVTYGLIILFALLMQSTLLIYYRPLGVIPDLLMILVICGAILKGSKFGAKLGLVVGLLHDLTIGGFGTMIIIKVFIGYLVGTLERKVFKKQLVVPILVVFVMTFFHEFIFLLLTEHLIFSIPPLWAVKTKILPLAIINVIFTIPIYISLYLVEKRLR